MIYFFVGLWVVCAVLSFGLVNANFMGAEVQLAHNPFSSRDRKNFRDVLAQSLLISLAAALIGPLGTFIVFCMTDFGREGLRFTPISETELENLGM